MMNVLTKRPNRIVRAASHRWHLWQLWQNNNFYKRLPVGEAFSTIYQSQEWGSREGQPFCSGEGSVREDAVGPYCEMVSRFMKEKNIKRVVDLGCGDFHVGARLMGPDIHYTGVDVVPLLIDYNQQHFGSANAEFRCLNMIEDELPAGELCLVRQVMQHLSNAQIQQTLGSLSRYRFAIITEHVYAGPGLRRNLDKPHGPGIRFPKRSGVFLESAPFNCPVTMLLEVPIKENEVLRSVLVSFDGGRAKGLDETQSPVN